MVEVKVIASGSSGNCSAVTFGKVTILFDAGIGIKRILKGLDFKLPKAALITHEHGDHYKKSTIEELLRRGVDVWLWSKIETTEKHHRLRHFEVNQRYNLAKDISFYAIEAFHDVPTVSFCVEVGNEKVHYITDTGKIPEFGNEPDYLIIEANYNLSELMNSNIESESKTRILQNHLSVEATSRYIKHLVKCKEVHLVHQSKRHCVMEGGVIDDNAGRIRIQRYNTDVSNSQDA